MFQQLFHKYNLEYNQKPLQHVFQPYALIAQKALGNKRDIWLLCYLMCAI